MRTNKNQGFTVVELIIVIVVIIVLSSLVFFAYSGIQQKHRNLIRKGDVTRIAAQLERFYSQNGYYPALKDINSSAFVTKNLPALHVGDLSDPSNPSSSTKLVAAPAAKSYAYHVVNDAGTSCESDATTCTKYTLTATYEGSFNGSKKFVKTSFVN